MPHFPPRWLNPSVGVALVVLSSALPTAAQTLGAGAALTGPQRAPDRNRLGWSDQAYELAPGDTISIAFRYTPEFNEDVVIGSDGRVALRSAGLIQAAGQTLEGFKRAVAESSRLKLVNPEVAVTIKDFDRPHVYVAGEVNSPGREDLRHPTTVLQAILMSGGPKDDAAMNRVLLFRRIDAETAEVHVLRLGKYSKRSRGENDMLLEPGDMVLVRHDVPSRIERFVKMANLGFYLNPLQNVTVF